MREFREYTVEPGQTQIDVALEQYGAIEGLLLLRADNPALANFDAELAGGQVLRLRNAPTPDPNSELRGATVEDIRVLAAYRANGTKVRTEDVAGLVALPSAFSFGFSIGFES